jgi:hypothetical protein
VQNCTLTTTLSSVMCPCALFAPGPGESGSVGVSSTIVNASPSLPLYCAASYRTKTSSPAAPGLYALVAFAGASLIGGACGGGGRCWLTGR